MAAWMLERTSQPSSSRVPWRPLEFDDVAFGIADIERRPLAFRAVARACFTDLDSLLGQVGADLGLIVPVERDAEVIEVAPFLAWRRAAHAAHLAVDRHQIDQGAAGPYLGQSDLRLLALHPAAQDVAIEPHHPVAVAHPEDDVVQALDLERGFVHGAEFRSVSIVYEIIPTATFEPSWHHFAGQVLVCHRP